jgi:hypothetical protein
MFASYLMMRTGNIRAIQKLLGHKSIRTTEIHSQLSERHLHGVAGQLPGPKMGTLLGTPVVLPGRAMAQVVDKKVVGDRGFEPLTPTVCKFPENLPEASLSYVFCFHWLNFGGFSDVVRFSPIFSYFLRILATVPATVLATLLQSCS